MGEAHLTKGLRSEGGTPSDTRGNKISPLYLRRMKIESFGAFSNTIIGPFTPGMNVLFGKNEAGKTTLNAFFSGILFGWEEARGTRNTYKPRNAERAGSLFFEDVETREEFELSRFKNSEGLQGNTSLISDIDKETYSTMFGLTSDELRSLRNTTDVTAKLLTAGSGTSASPAQALAELQSRIAEYTSKAAGLEHSLVQLNQKQEELSQKIAEATKEADRFKQQDKEFREIAPQREDLLRRLNALNGEIEMLAAHRASLEKLERLLEKNLEQKRSLLEEEQALGAQQERREEVNDALVDMGSSQEFALKDKIETLMEERNKTEHGVYMAKENYTTSKASYEALLEAEDVQGLEKKVRRQRKVQIALSLLLPLIFLGAGIPVLVQGRTINSLSFTALGICLILFSLLLAGAALVVLFRPNKAEEALTQRKQDAQWVMLQDKKKLEASTAEMNDQELKTQQFLNSVGLEEAHGSLKRARILLEEAKEARSVKSLFIQKKQALISQLSSVEETLVDISLQKSELVDQLGLSPDTSLNAIDQLISQKTLQRTTLIETSENINRRYGELKQSLSQAKNMKRLDELKLAYQQVRTRQKESSEDYARLLLAKRALETAISAWESESQPEVYKQASRLLSLMTMGRWVKVRMTPEGKLQIIDEVKTVREPMHLSLGTCQQLYLSLRIALLITAGNVGQALPIMADDILVNFDADRRRGAVEALLELAHKRQVILFTCHEEIVRLMQTSDSPVNVLEL